MLFDTESLKPQENYQLLAGGVTPRPIAWISTLSRDGTPNLAPYSFFNVASCQPPVLWYAQVNPRGGGDKDTLRNLIDTGECVVNVVTAALLDPMNQSCAALPPEHSEFDFAAVARCPSHRVKPFSVAAAPIRYECTLREVIRIATLPTGGSVALLDVRAVYVDDALLTGTQIDQARVGSIGKMGGDFYSLTDTLVARVRP